MPDGYLCSSHDFNRGPIHYKINPSLLERDPYFRGWLYRILPSNPASDLQWLSL